ncbi:MAG TPA: phosphate ABC transporter permease PstA [Nitrososphaerales archaeon]|nr:phosphate ABC transporter permease PstA [Nitrososphaerales archaeon]
MNLRRMVADRILISFCVLAVVIAVIPLASILYDVTALGISSVNLAFFTELPPTPLPGAVGGLGNAVQGTLILVGLATAIGFPFGLFSGVYISEYGSNWYGYTVRFFGDVLAGNPSIVFGILGYILLVLPFRSFSIIAGGLTLGIMMMPIISNTTAEALKLVPNSLREASMALGIRKWRTTLLVVSNAKGSVATGSLLAVARVMGETAPLILTAGISTLWFSGPFQPAASLTYYIYYFATSPFQNWVRLAWGAAFVLIVTIMVINIGVRIATRGGRAHA